MFLLTCFIQLEIEEHTILYNFIIPFDLVKRLR